MPKYVCVRRCFHKLRLWNEGEYMTVAEGSDYIPPHHFELVESDKPKVKEPEVAPEDEEAEIETIRAEFEKLGAAFDRRWGKQRLENELILARKSRGE